MGIRKDNRKEYIIIFMVGMGAIIMILGIVAAVIGSITDTIKSENICGENGYERASFSGVELGYVKCYNETYIDHILTDEELSEAFEYNSWFRGGK